MSGRKVMVQPINIIFNHLQKVFSLNQQSYLDYISISHSHTTTSFWLFDNNEFRIEAFIIGFDEFMNLVLDDAEEVYIEKSGRETKARQDLGRILLKGDNITVIEAVNA